MEYRRAVKDAAFHADLALFGPEFAQAVEKSKVKMDFRFAQKLA